MIGSNGDLEPADSTSYLALARRVNLTRQIVEFRGERSWAAGGSTLERARQFFVARGSIPYSPDKPFVLSESSDEPLRAVSVFFGPPGSEQVIVFARRQNALNYTLIHLIGTDATEVDVFPLDRRFGSMKQASVMSLFGWRMRWGTFDQYVKPVEFVRDEETESIKIVVRVNVALEDGPGNEMPALLCGQVVDEGYRWSIAKIGQDSDWYPSPNTKLFPPGYEPHQVDFGENTEEFICKGLIKTGPSAGRWAVWNDRSEGDGFAPLVTDLEPESIGCMAVDKMRGDKTIYTCALGPLSEPHPLANNTPAILLSSARGRMGLVPLEGVADVNSVLGVRVAGSSSGIFHCLNRGPSARLVVHQNGVPIRAEYDDAKLHAFNAEECDDPSSTIRVLTVTSEDNERCLMLRVAASTAWPETLAMMDAPLEQLTAKAEQQRQLFEGVAEKRQGRSLKVFKLDELQPKVNRATVMDWWSYVSGKAETHNGRAVGPRLTRRDALDLLENYRTEDGALVVEPLLLPLADLFGVDVTAQSGLDGDSDFQRLCEDVRTYLSENNLMLLRADTDPDCTEGMDDVVVVLHPAALAWADAAQSEEEMLEAAGESA